jgi:hypothetical protein
MIMFLSHSSLCRRMQIHCQVNSERMTPSKYARRMAWKCNDERALLSSVLHVSNNIISCISLTSRNLITELLPVSPLLEKSDNDVLQWRHRYSCRHETVDHMKHYILIAVWLSVIFESIYTCYSPKDWNSYGISIDIFYPALVFVCSITLYCIPLFSVMRIFNLPSTNFTAL